MFISFKQPDADLVEGLIISLLLISWDKAPSGRLSQTSNIVFGV
jgi:hypothetical protein